MYTNTKIHKIRYLALRPGHEVHLAPVPLPQEHLGEPPFTVFFGVGEKGGCQ